MTTEMETLAALATASSKSFTLDLANAYRTLPAKDIAALVDKGLWFVLSATQGNLTEKGAEALTAYKREQANHKAVVDALLADAASLGLQVEVKDAHTFKLTVAGSFMNLSRAELALFLVEERLVQAGKIV